VFAPPVKIPRVQLQLYWAREVSESPAGQWLRTQLRSLFTPA
jgi:hypothetical protein